MMAKMPPLRLLYRFFVSWSVKPDIENIFSLQGSSLDFLYKILDKNEANKKKDETKRFLMF